MKKILLSFLAIVLLIEEALWDLFTALGRYLSKRLHLEQIEAWLQQTKPMMALLAFSIPVLIVAPINIIAFAMMARGLLLQGLLLEIFAKLLGTLLVTRVFALTKPQLMTFRLLNYVYTTITSWLHWAHDKVTGTFVYQRLKQFKVYYKAKFQS
jgi:hypothetical protein